MLFRSGEKTGPTVELAAGTRKTINVADTLAGEWSVSTRVSSDKPILAERAMYGNKRTWGHDSIGVTAPATAWYLAEGSTGKNEVDSFETWVLLANPGSEKATAHVFYMTPTGEKTGPTVELAAGTRKTINVADTVGEEWDVSTRVSSDKPILAERAMYGNKRTWGTDSIGVTAPATTWYLAEGSTGTGFETWVLVQNPNPNNVDVDLTFMTLSGEVQGPTATVPANSRMTFNVADYVSNTFDVSTTVTSSGPAGANGVIVERAMYGSGT